MQTQRGDVLAVDDDAALCRLDDAEQRQGQGRLAGTRTTHDADLTNQNNACCDRIQRAKLSSC